MCRKYYFRIQFHFTFGFSRHSIEISFEETLQLKGRESELILIELQRDQVSFDKIMIYSSTIAYYRLQFFVIVRRIFEGFDIKRSHFIW